MTEKAASRLTWNEGRYGSQNGVAGDVTLFVINGRTQRDHLRWQMSTELPGLAGRVWEDDDTDALKAQAEDVLDDWLTRVGGDDEPGECQCPENRLYGTCGH